MTEAARYPEIDRRSGLALREFIRDYRSQGKPVVIADAMDTWRARSAWTFDYFRTRYYDSPIEVYTYNDVNNDYSPDRVRTMPLGEFIGRVISQDWRSFPCYVRDDWKLFQRHSELLADYTVPEYFYDWFNLVPSFMRLIYPRIFIGPKGAITPLHQDIWGTHAWLAQIAGRKRWILFPPEQKEFLCNFEVRPDKPDFEKFPRFREARGCECTIGPGDTIFVPSGWIHQVISLDATISLTHNYMGPGCFRPCLANSVRDLMVKRTSDLAAKVLRRPPSSTGDPAV